MEKTNDIKGFELETGRMMSYHSEHIDDIIFILQEDHTITQNSADIKEAYRKLKESKQFDPV